MNTAQSTPAAELDILREITSDGTHVEAEQLLRTAGWTPCGAGDWAIALRCPGGCHVARIAPFDPASPFTARLYGLAAHTGRVPRLDLAWPLEGGGHLMVMEFLHPVDPEAGAAFVRALESGDDEFAELTRIVAQVHGEMAAALPWCGPLDTNSGNVMSRADKEPVLIDPFFVDGTVLYPLILTDPVAVARAFPRHTRRFMLDLPLTYSGPWDEDRRARMRANLAAADALLGSAGD